MLLEERKRPDVPSWRPGLSVEAEAVCAEGAWGVVEALGGVAEARAPAVNKRIEGKVVDLPQADVEAPSGLERIS